MDNAPNWPFNEVEAKHGHTRPDESTKEAILRRQSEHTANGRAQNDWQDRGPQKDNDNFGDTMSGEKRFLSRHPRKRKNQHDLSVRPAKHSAQTSIVVRIRTVVFAFPVPVQPPIRSGGSPSSGLCNNWSQAHQDTRECMCSIFTAHSEVSRGVAARSMQGTQFCDVLPT